MATILCPNGDGGFDCTPFCNQCEGDQVIICKRCSTKVLFDTVSEGYYAVCPTHDEDLYQIETVTA